MITSFGEEMILHLRFDCRDVQFEARVNDFPVFSERKGLRCICRIPINHHVVTGTNLLQIDFSNSALTDTAHLSIALVTRNASISTQDSKELLSLDNSNFDTPNLSPQSTTFLVDHSFPEWNWSQAKPADPIKEVRESLEKEFRNLHRMYEQDDRSAILKARTMQIRELSLASYKSIESIEQNINDELDVIRSQPELRLMPLDFDNVRVERYCNGRVLTFLDEEGDSIIYFMDPESAWCAMIPAYFTRDSLGRFLLCR